MSEAIFARLRYGVISTSVALMELLIEYEDLATVEDLVERFGPDALRAELKENRMGCARIVRMLGAGFDVPGEHASVEAGIASARTLFDWSVQQSEETSVALYSLGNPRILGEATSEIVRWMVSLGVVGAETRALQIGCGIGRIEQALAPRVREAIGIDISSEMITVARRRCAGLANVSFATCSGHDLADFPDERFDLVYAIDSFPYLVQAGMELVRTHVLEAERVLTPGGCLALASFSYRGSAFDTVMAARLAEEAGLVLGSNGDRPFQTWDAAVFVMTKPS